ncbi:hypothetical protein B0A55_07745 [Friedmanniomyces simplex]|uniref:F-box domain-containing protein n=1 Tax=Friedmanniomyces simplex TaxID=329884 RepID=A0A4U0XH74_9PEZI|nr:hypothetical protein B0A55_07745 [Friedmanniomyces simplex]
MDSAASQVLRLPELLELVLLHLSQKDLLLSQRTSRSFRNTVKGSIVLQRALFLAPDWKLEGRAFDAYSTTNRPGQKPENNRLLLRAFPGNYPTVSLVIVNDSPTPMEFATGRRGSEHWSWDVCVSFPADKLPTCVPAVSYPEASWRRMYLSQPPCADLYLARRYQRSTRPAMVRENGITMGELFDESICAKEKANWHVSYISSDRDWHFEGNIKCSSLEESPLEAEESADIFTGYVFSKTVRNGTARAYSDDWDPGLYENPIKAATIVIEKGRFVSTCHPSQRHGTKV